ncbi:MAG: hypothetical protein WCL21_10635 [Mariniphaga sp.]
MKFLKWDRLLVCVFMFSAGNLFALDIRPVIFHSGKAEIKYEDHLHQEFYWWPNTLLSYPVVFEEKVALEELILADQKSGKQLPFQFSGVEKTADGKTKAILNLMADMPSGGSFDLVLKKGNLQNFDKIRVEKKEKEILLQSDLLSVWLPVSQDQATDFLPGPVLGISMNGKSRMGSSTFQAGGKKLQKLDSKIVSDGPLFAEAEVKYLFADGSTYQANIRCIKGYEFIELKERINGFSAGSKTFWEMGWTGFSPTHRQAPNHPYGNPKETPGFKRYDWEEVGQNMLNSHHGITVAGSDGKIPFEVGIYGNWPAERTVTSSVFWDEKGMQSVGVFMQDASFWDDKEYSIWSVSGKLSVRFYYQDGKLRSNYPVYDGQRSTALSCYSHQKDIDYMTELERLSSPKKANPRTKISQLSYNTFLQNRHSTIDLNRVKDWELSYPAPLPLSPVIFELEKGLKVESLDGLFLNGGYSVELAVSGPCQNSGYSPTPARSFYGAYVGAFNQLLPKATTLQRERLAAMFLMHAYTAAGEEYMPMRAMFSGHPNFLSDVKSIPAFAAFLFPKHPEAKNWQGSFGKYIDLNTHNHVRPDVKSWNATGGRWTENLGTYVWAYLKPSLRANYLLQNYFNGVNNFANTNNAMLGSWLLNSLSAPYDGESLDYYRDANKKLDAHFWGIVSKENGPRRVHPPQGAHSARRMPSASMWLLGQELKYYEPLLSENISYVSHPEDIEEEIMDRSKDPFGIMYPKEGDHSGTPPDFKSAKFTGYGIVLRAAVGTKDELSVHLQQIDKGPNYRWGIAADGGCGTIYFYAAGKSYSHNGKEDIGDRRIQDTDLITNFGVFKDGSFKAVGKGDLTRPLYDFSSGQFAEIVSTQKDGYSWPEYQGRSIMLLGSDYFMIYDDVYNPNMGTRFSWFTHPEEDLPELNVVKGGGAGYIADKGKPEMIKVFGHETKGLWFDGTGDCLTFVSHKKGFTQETTPYGCIVTAPSGSKDYIFRNDKPVQATVKGYIFDGTAGFIREREAGRQELALFHGTKIGNADFEIQTTNTDGGISAVYSGSQNISGQYSGLTASPVTFQWTGAVPANLKFYLDGVKTDAKPDGNKLLANVPAGKHIWTLTVGLPDLPSPEFDFTRNEKGKVTVAIRPVTGAGKYKFEYSTDGITNWKLLKEQATATLQIKPSGTEAKGYVRVIASNTDHQSVPSLVYPAYFTSEKPHFPDGLRLAIEPGKVRLSWGKVLGCTEYKLMRRVKGAEKYQVIYKGKNNQLNDQPAAAKVIYEYAVQTTNGNGESELCNPVDTDPDSWINFNPRPGEKFRRVASTWSETDNSGARTDPYYPE